MTPPAVVTGDTGTTVAVALAGGLIVTPRALTHLIAHPAMQGQVLTVACLQGHRLPTNPDRPAPAGLFAAHN